MSEKVHISRKYELGFTIEVPDANAAELAYELAFGALAGLLGSESVQGGTPLEVQDDD